MNKAWLIAMAFLLAISIAEAQTYRVNEDLDLKVPCINNGTYCSAATTCNLTLMDFNENALINNQAMTSQTAYFNYTTTLSEVGEYQVFMSCTDGTSNGFFPAIITMTRNGKEPAEGVFKLFIWVAFIIATAGLFITLILNVAKLITAEETIYGVIISWLFVIFILLIQYLSEYLLENLVYNMSGTFLEIAIWTNGIVPGIGLILTMIIKGLKKKRPLNINELNGRLYGR